MVSLIIHTSRDDTYGIRASAYLQSALVEKH